MTTCQHEAAAAIAAATPERPCDAIEWECEICSTPLGAIGAHFPQTYRTGDPNTCPKGRAAHTFGFCDCDTYTACHACGKQF